MGDRANIVIETNVWAKGEDGQFRETEDTKRVYLYSHWRGQSIVNSAIKGLESGRSTDSAYLARVVFQDMLDGDDSETGFGISAELGDNEHPIVVINPDKKTVRIETRDWDDTGESSIAYGPYPYARFLADATATKPEGSYPEGWLEKIIAKGGE